MGLYSAVQAEPGCKVKRHTLSPSALVAIGAVWAPQRLSARVHSCKGGPFTLLRAANPAASDAAAQDNQALPKGNVGKKFFTLWRIASEVSQQNEYP